MSAQRTLAPSNTGPSVQARTKRLRPSSPTTGSTQVMQIPVPQAIAASTATWVRTPCSAAISVTCRSIPIGPQA